MDAIGKKQFVNINLFCAKEKKIHVANNTLKKAI